MEPTTETECIHGLDPHQCGICTQRTSRGRRPLGLATSGRTFALIHAPDLEPITFVHLNVQGDTWKIREYPGPDVSFIERAGSGVDAGEGHQLRDIRIAIWEPYPHTSTRAGESIENTRYWHDEIQKLKRTTRHRSFISRPAATGALTPACQPVAESR